MNASVATHVGLEEVMQLLEVETIPGKPWQRERLRKWIERLVENRGKEYVRRNRRDLIGQWEQYTDLKFKSCI